MLVLKELTQYSLVITCMENRINPYMYFTYMDLTDKEELRTLNGSLRILSKREIKEILEQQTYYVVLLISKDILSNIAPTTITVNDL